MCQVGQERLSCYTYHIGPEQLHYLPNLTGTLERLAEINQGPIPLFFLAAR